MKIIQWCSLIVVIFLLTACSVQQTLVKVTVTPGHTPTENLPAISVTLHIPPVTGFQIIPTSYPEPINQPTITIKTFSAPPTPIPTDDIHYPIMPLRAVQIFFVDNLHGWLLGNTDVGITHFLAMAIAQNGGKTWQASPMPDVDLFYWWGIQAGIVFANTRDGWFYDQGLFSTHDGGLTWHDEKPDGMILRMGKASDGSIWALEEDYCKCNWKIKVASHAPFSQWKVTISKFPINLEQDPDDSFYRPVEIVLADPQTAWLSYWTFDINRPIAHLMATKDGGRQWQELHSPCSDYPTDQGDLSAVDKNNLWLGCGAAAGAGSGSKFIFTSSDGGKNWAIVGKGATPPQQGNTLSTCGYFSHLDALSPTFAYMKWDRTMSVMITNDGGKTWDCCAPLPCSAGFDNVLFIDPLNGWDYDQTCIIRTINGGKSWDCIQLPDNKPCVIP